MNFSHLTDEMLNASNVAVAKEEREVLSKALHHFMNTQSSRWDAPMIKPVGELMP